MPLVAALSAALLVPAQEAARPCPDLYRCAAEAARAGDLARARALVDERLAERSDDADALLLAGNLALREGRLEDAERALDRAAAIAPAYPDVFAARARLRLRRGDAPGARRELARARSLGSAEVDEIARRIDRLGAARRWTIAVQHAVSDVSGGQTWHDTLLTVARTGARVVTTVELERSQRFGLHDERLQFRADVPLRGGSAYAGVVATIDPEFRESWGLRAGGELQATDRLDLTIDGRFSRFGRIDTESVGLGARVWTASHRAFAHLSLLNFWDEFGRYRAGVALRGAADLSAAVQLLGGYARYPETLAAVTQRTDAAHVGVVWRMSDHHVMRLTAEHEERRNAFRRDTLSLGFSVQL